MAETRETELVVDTLETFQSLCRMRFGNDWILHNWNTFDEVRGGGIIGHYQQVMVASLWTKLVSLTLLLLLSGCVHVRRYFATDFNRRQYEKCVAKHGGETWQWNGLPLTCRQLTYPSTICDVDGCVANGEQVVP